MIKSRSSLGPDPVLAYRRHFLLLIFLFNILSSPSHAECYFPDGSVEQTDIKEYQPCDPGDEHSMCCATNRTDADRCRSDGFCFSTWDLNLWRDGCTDPTWESPRCNKLCIAGEGRYAENTFDLATRETTITRCENGSFCCGNGTIGNACCREGKGLFMSSGMAVSVTSSSSSTKANLSPSSQNDHSQTTSTSANTAVPHGSPTSTAPASPSSTSSARPSDKTGVIVGGVIGGVAVLALLIGIISWTWMHHNRRNSEDRETAQRARIGQFHFGEDVVPTYNEVYGVNTLRPRAELEPRIIAELEPGSFADLEHPTMRHKR